MRSTADILSSVPEQMDFIPTKIPAIGMFPATGDSEELLLPFSHLNYCASSCIVLGKFYFG
jgi:hypothetical protein